MKDIIEYRNSLRRIKDFDSKEIISKYKEFADRNTVFRSLSQKPNQIKTFGLRNRIGYHETGDTSRGEEILCHALFNTYKPEKDMESGESNATKNEALQILKYGQHIIDYQTPLKNKAKDSLWGKFDLIGQIKSSSKKKLCFWEVKFGKNSDPIHFAIMELLIYYAQFDLTSKSKEKAKKNYQNFLREAALVRGAGGQNNTITIYQDNLPVLFIAADEIYYKYHDWESTKELYKQLKKKLEDELKLKLEFLQIEAEWSYNEKSKRTFFDKNNEIKVL